MVQKKSTVKINNNGIFYIEEEDTGLRSWIGDTCSICLGMPSREQIIPCGHVFCSSCLNEWVSQGLYKNTCPLCRFPFDVFEVQRHQPLILRCNKRILTSYFSINKHKRQFGTILLYEEKITHVDFSTTLTLSLFICMTFIVIGYLLG